MMQPQRRCVSPGSIIKLSVGQRGLNTLQRERRRDVQPHMHLLTTSYFHSHEWGPHTDGPRFRQTARAKTFHNTSSIQCREKLFFGVFTEQNPQGGLSSGCKSKESLRESSGEEEKRVAFLRICKAVSYYLQSFMWCKGLFIANFAKTVSCKTTFTFVWASIKNTESVSIPPVMDVRAVIISGVTIRKVWSSPMRTWRLSC